MVPPKTVNFVILSFITEVRMLPEFRRKYMADAAVSPYDKVLYPSYTRIQTHPDRMATIGRLLGMKPAPVERCRVLELGCGNGSNLGPIAFGLPESEFMGVDLAVLPIEKANRMVAELGLKNTRFQQGNVTEVGSELGKFDYIICHGVYSWAPVEARESILRICRENLQPNGIGFISYNAYPGNRMREMIREMMLFHVSGFADPKEQIEQARALAEFVAAAQDESDLYRRFLKEEMELFLRQDRNYIFHDALAEINTPFYFYQFMQQAESRGLKYLGEADFHVMLDLNLPPEVSAKLDLLSGNRIAREQYMDFLRCRRFRQTLLCQREVELDLALKPAQLANFYISGLVRPMSENPDPYKRVLEKFENRQAARIQTDSPLAKTAFQILTHEWPQALPFAELLRRTKQQLSGNGWISENPQRDEYELQAVLFRSYASGLVELHSYSPNVNQQLSERPAASPLALWQSKQANFVTSLFHSAMLVEDELVKELLGLLDGTRDRTALITALEASVDHRRKASGAAGKPIAEDTEARKLLHEGLDKNLAKLAKMGLLAS
jgi:methyltransferase-like protein/2-polyprenyl-3-methyl-5-hydroxy-6-metoxy-1,4-benzoquinol methylase